MQHVLHFMLFLGTSLTLRIPGFQYYMLYCNKYRERRTYEGQLQPEARQFLLLVLGIKFSSKRSLGLFSCLRVVLDLEL